MIEDVISNERRRASEMLRMVQTLAPTFLGTKEVGVAGPGVGQDWGGNIQLGDETYHHPFKVSVSNSGLSVERGQVLVYTGGTSLEWMIPTIASTDLTDLRNSTSSPYDTPATGVVFLKFNGYVDDEPAELWGSQFLVESIEVDIDSDLPEDTEEARYIAIANLAYTSVNVYVVTQCVKSDFAISWSNASGSGVHPFKIIKVDDTHVKLLTGTVVMSNMDSGYAAKTIPTLGGTYLDAATPPQLEITVNSVIYYKATVNGIADTNYPDAQLIDVELDSVIIHREDDGDAVTNVNVVIDPADGSTVTQGVFYQRIGRVTVDAGVINLVENDTLKSSHVILWCPEIYVDGPQSWRPYGVT